MTAQVQGVWPEPLAPAFRRIEAVQSEATLGFGLRCGAEGCGTDDECEERLFESHDPLTGVGCELHWRASLHSIACTTDHFAKREIPPRRHPRTATITLLVRVRPVTGAVSDVDGFTAAGVVDSRRRVTNAASV